LSVYALKFSKFIHLQSTIRSFYLEGTFWRWSRE